MPAVRHNVRVWIFGRRVRCAVSGEFCVEGARCALSVEQLEGFRESVKATIQEIEE